jgi:hypothetical protein
MDGGLTLTETLLAQSPSQQFSDCPGNWEVGRLVLLPEYRSDPDALKRCLFLSLAYLCRHTEVKNLYASCTHVLSRLYRRFGFSTFAKDVVLQGTEKSYNLIHGYPTQVLNALVGSKAEAPEPLQRGGPH